MEKKDREIAGILTGKGISWNDMSESKKNLARKVYDAAIPRIERLNELSEQTKKQKFNKQILAEELGINRKTLGSNNPEIAVLIDVLVKRGQTYYPTAKSVSGIKGEMDALKERLELLTARDCELVQKDQEYRKLEKEYKLQKTQYEEKKKEYDELKAKYDELEIEMKNMSEMFSGKANKRIS